MVMIVFGLPGSGKSYFASRLAVPLAALYVNSDERRMKLFSTRTYTDAEKMLVYDSMLADLVAAMKDKKSIVLDATFYTEAIRNRFEQAAKAYNEQVIYIEVTAPENIISERLKKPRLYSEANVDVYRKLKVIFEPLLKDHLVLTSTNYNITSMLEKALQYIKTIK